MQLVGLSQRELDRAHCQQQALCHGAHTTGDHLPDLLHHVLISPLHKWNCQYVLFLAFSLS